jgi:HAD superfamily hydrolase (TIGR01509 family)
MPSVSLDDTDAWVFDLDGVITDTAELHRRAWTQLFDELFRSLPAGAGTTPPAPFSAEDYHRLVDGEDRMDGVRNVLRDRGIALAEGRPADPPGLGTVAGLAEKKDRAYLDLLAREGSRPFASSIDLIRRLKAAGVGVGVVSASRHCAQVLEAAHMNDLVDVRVDGHTADAMSLPGKPDPALFVEAALRLGTEPSRAVVVEDAVAGVKAGSAGRFGLVIGVDRTGHRAELSAGGAHIVVGDLGEIVLEGRGPSDNPWWLVYEDPTASNEGVVETLCTLGNGYLATRGAAPWARDDGFSYPGTYLAGVYNRLASQVMGQTVEVESLVNAPNWLRTVVRAVDEGSWATTDDGATVSAHRMQLDLRSGLLVRRCVVTDPLGRATSVTERRLVSMADPHLVAIQLTCAPVNWTGTLGISCSLDGAVADDETVEDRLLANHHLELVDQGSEDPSGAWLKMRTLESHIVIAMASRCLLSGQTGGARFSYLDAPGAPETRISVPLKAGARVTLEKIVAVFTSKDRAISEPGVAARSSVSAQQCPSFDDLVARQRLAWAPLWRLCAMTMEGERGSSEVLNLHLFHLLQVASPHLVETDAGLGARGLHGEGYRGHVFWDATLVFPVVNLRFPEVSRALIGYRVRRLPAARRAAAAAGRRGAMFPWQSGSDGRDETPNMLFNPLSGRWMADHSHLQRHVGLAIAYDAWQHWQVTGDLEFLRGSCAELVLEIARFFAGLATWDATIGRYRITGVMGPDEFHDGYPWSSEPGVDDNAYTNVMTAWVLARAGEIAGLLEGRPAFVLEKLGLHSTEVSLWDRISRELHVPFHEGVMSQFDGYDRLERIDLEAYLARYGNIGRLDLILESEGDTVRRYQVSKQADVLMLLYLMSAEELRAVLGRMGYPFDPALIRRTIDYYSERVTHGSSLSRVVHAWVMARRDRQASWRYLQDAFGADIADTQGGTTREGIHLGAMAGTADILQRCYPGLEVRQNALWLNPVLPVELEGLRFNLRFRGNDVSIDVDRRRVRVEVAPGLGPRSTLMLGREAFVLGPGETVEAAMNGAD